MSATIASDSLDAVPLPIAIRFISYLKIRSRTIERVSAILFWGSVGKTRAVSNTFPYSSTTASLHPVLNAGSQPKTTLLIIGACINSCSRFFEKTLIDLSSAFSKSWFRSSLSIAGAMSLLYESSMASVNVSSVYLL